MNDACATNTRQQVTKLTVIIYSFSYFFIFSHAAILAAIFGFTWVLSVWVNTQSSRVSYLPSTIIDASFIVVYKVRFDTTTKNVDETLCIVCCEAP